MGRTWVLVSTTVKHGRIRSTPRKSMPSSPSANRTHWTSAARLSFWSWAKSRQRKEPRGKHNTTQMSQSHSQIGSRISQRWNNHQAMQRETDNLKKKLHRAQQRRSLYSLDISSNEEEDVSYRRRSRTPPSETFSYEKEPCHERRLKSPSSKGLGNEAMNKVWEASKWKGQEWTHSLAFGLYEFSFKCCERYMWTIVAY